MNTFTQGQTVYIIVGNKAKPAAITTGVRQITKTGRVLYAITRDGYNRGRSTPMDEDWIFTDEESARKAIETRLRGWLCYGRPANKQDLDNKHVHISVAHRSNNKYRVFARIWTEVVPRIDTTITADSMDMAKRQALDMLTRQATEKANQINDLLSMLEAETDKLERKETT